MLGEGLLAGREGKVLIAQTKREGVKYQQTKGLMLKDLAALIRKEVREAAKTGRIPTEWRYAVRKRDYRAIDTYIIVPDEVETLREEFQREYEMPLTQYTVANYPEFFNGKYYLLKMVVDAEKFVTELVGAYNYDNNDIMTDYFDTRFFGGVKVIGTTYYDRYYK